MLTTLRGVPLSVLAAYAETPVAVVARSGASLFGDTGTLEVSCPDLVDGFRANGGGRWA